MVIEAACTGEGPMRFPIVDPELGDPVRTIGARTFDFSRQVAVMGIVNRTVDSFYDRGATFALEKAVAAALRAVADGADWVDIGAVPFSPLAAEVDERAELARLLPVVEAVRAGTDAVISVDTYRAEVARRALQVGADAVNDTSGLHDPDMAGVVADAGATLVVTHSRAAPGEPLRRPHYGDVVAEVGAFLLDRAACAVEQGVAKDRIVIDPGHDLNKNTLHSLELTRRLGELSTLGFPVLASVSNKDFVQETLGRPVEELTEGTVAAVVMCVLAGARIVRVHDVAAVRAGLGVVEAVLGWRPPVGVLRHNV
jgi:dihydropteroate synthase